MRAPLIGHIAWFMARQRELQRSESRHGDSSQASYRAASVPAPRSYDDYSYIPQNNSYNKVGKFLVRRLNWLLAGVGNISSENLDDWATGFLIEPLQYSFLRTDLIYYRRLQMCYMNLKTTFRYFAHKVYGEIFKTRVYNILKFSNATMGNSPSVANALLWHEGDKNKQ